MTTLDAGEILPADTSTHIHHGLHSALLKKLAKLPEVVTSDEELIDGLKAGDAGASYQLFCKYYKYILAKIIQITKGRWYSDDLLQAGAVGIYEAALRWHIRRKIKFLTYAHYYILKRLYMEARNEMLPLGGLGIGRDEKERLYNFIKLKMMGLSDPEIKDKLHCSQKSLDRLATLNSYASHICSLDNNVESNAKSDLEGYNKLGTPAAESAEGEFMDLEFGKYISGVIRELMKDHPLVAKVLNYELGLNGYEVLGRRAIAAKLKKSISEVSYARREGNVLLRRRLIEDGYYNE